MSHTESVLNAAMSLPGMLFRETQIANIRTSGARVSSKEGLAKIVENSVLQEIRFGDDAARDAFLSEYMGFVPYAS